MELLVIYTDIFYKQPHEHESDAIAGLIRGDMPAIIGSFSAIKNNQTWEFAVNQSEIISKYPNSRVISDEITKVRKRVFDKTGYNLLSRPFNLLNDPQLSLGATNEILGIPNGAFTKEAIKVLIDNAADKNVIIDVNDTGFDIDPNTPLAK